MDYHYLIAGLPDIQLEDTKVFQPLVQFKEELKDVLSEKDFQLVKILFLQYDNENLLSFLNNKEAELNELGIYSVDELADFILQIKESDNPQDKRIPIYFKEFVPAYLAEKPLYENLLWEDQLSTLYYSFASKTKNKFLDEWFEFNLNVNNIIAAYTCRKYEFNIQRAIIGETEIAETLRKSNSRDFGLSGMFDYLDDVLRLMEEENLLERERKLDELRWKYLDEKTFFHYFSIEKILAYLIKMQIISRWMPLNKERGGQVFREMIEGMRESVEVK